MYGFANSGHTTAVITAVFAACRDADLSLPARARGAAAAACGGRGAWARLHATLRHARGFRDLRRFLFCTVFYQAGIAVVIALAAIYTEQAMKFKTHRRSRSSWWSTSPPRRAPLRSATCTTPSATCAPWRAMSPLPPRLAEFFGLVGV
jgi:hypothetical protein